MCQASAGILIMVVEREMEQIDTLKDPEYQLPDFG
jgi:hypothetical protein